MTRVPSGGQTITRRMYGTWWCQQANEYGQIAVELGYDTADPLAVWLDIGGSLMADPERWYVARDLLNDGLFGLVGEGDVRVWPQPGSVVIELIGVNDEHRQPFSGVLTLRRAPVQEFLYQTFRLMPRACEEEKLGVDGAISKILESAGC